ncbi:hypothetical protein [Marinomonas sp. 2405UD68-3]|uniref:hypothetical protein n=1 Tax=Marinomonas sp. 2405UD68-3 TaxID=3391835 RepID=UPI0039C99331
MNDIITPDFTNLDKSEERESKKNSQKKILIIKGLTEMRFMLKSLVSSLGYRHVDLETTRQGVLKAVMGKHYDIAFSNYNLGSSIDGQQILEVTRKTYALDHSTVFIMITADTAYENT